MVDFSVNLKKTGLLLAASGLLVIFMFTATSPVSAAIADKPAPAASEALGLAEKAAKSLKLQTEMPFEPGDLVVSPDIKFREPFRFPTELANIILWVSAAVVLAIFLSQLYANYGTRSRSRRFSRLEPEIYAANQAAAARMDEAQLEADVLARQGLYAQAMHVLLLQSLGEMRRRLEVSIASSLTSREILDRIGLNPQGHAALADIIGRVEFTHFGCYVAGSDDYQACRRSFEALTGAMGTGRAGRAS